MVNDLQPDMVRFRDAKRADPQCDPDSDSDSTPNQGSKRKYATMSEDLGALYYIGIRAFGNANNRNLSYPDISLYL